MGKKNVKNFHNVQIGMDSLSVRKIMGISSERYVDRESVFYNYDVPPGSSFHCQIVLNKKGKVTFKSRVLNLEEK